MCGIAGIISRKNDDLREALAAMSAAVSHRGPDGEGFLVSDLEKAVPCSLDGKSPGAGPLNYLPVSTLKNAGISPRVLFAHRRLSIIDLSAAGHEPMCDSTGRIWITFNGEIYNYLELKTELASAGYRFRSSCDTEVIIYAYCHWGDDCVERFNGMWAFTILDLNKKRCFASRDRLGVKPFYYIDSRDHFAFASEQKAFVRSGLLKPEADEKALHNFVVNGLLETSPSNFFKGIAELWPGHNLSYDLVTHAIRLSKYYDLREHVTLENNRLSDEEIVGRARDLFEGSVRLRMRSDVEVGTCLSGGIDSSAIAVTIARLTEKPLHCFTASFPDQPFDEGRYARMVADQIGGIQHSVEPDEHDLMRDLDELIYSQDLPIWSTSTYAQHRVMGLAKRNAIKVVLDGQGADELFTGYHHHFTAKWGSLLSAGKMASLYHELRQARTSLSHPSFFYLKEKLKGWGLNRQNPGGLLKNEFVNAFKQHHQHRSFNNVNEQLLDDITRTRLKIFLKCEDRCGMWHGVESRTPFSDDKDLIGFMFSFDGNRKIQQGKLKYFLKEAVKKDLPAAIYNRNDKRGFETPMLKWVGSFRSQMVNETREAGFDFVNAGKLSRAHSPSELNLLFRVFAAARWKRVFGA